MRVHVRRLLILLIVPAALAAGASFGQQGGLPDPGQVARLVVGLANDFRGQEGLEKVEPNGRLTAAARYFADYLANTGQFSHEADGTDPAARAKQHGYNHCIVSENIAYRYSSAGFAAHELAEGFVDGWKKSPGHRRNMLDPDVTETGAAVARGGKTGHYYAVQMFGRPASQAIEFRIANRTSSVIRYRTGGRTLSLAPRQTRTHKQCRADELRFDWPGRRQDTTLRPKDGDRFAIVRTESAGFSLNRE